MTSSEFQNQINKLSGQLKQAQDKYVNAIKDLKQLSAVKVLEFIMSRGYQYQETETGFAVKIDDEVYQILTGNIPILTIRKVFKIPENQLDDFSSTAYQITCEKPLIKVSVFDNNLVFDLQSFELDYRHFAHAFDQYLIMLNVAIDDFSQILMKH